MIFRLNRGAAIFFPRLIRKRTMGRRRNPLPMVYHTVESESIFLCLSQRISRRLRNSAKPREN